MKKKREHIIKTIEPGSIAEELELEPGDVLVSVNGQPVGDVFDYHYLINEEYLELLVRKASGEEWELEIEKEYEDDLGIEFENGMMDDYRSCSNKCIFCFIDQLPKGMRDTGKLGRIGICLFLQIDQLQQAHGFCLRFCLCLQLQLHRSQHDIFLYGQVREQVKMLEHHTHAAADLIDVHARRGNLLSVEGNGSFRGLLQQVQAPQEGGFAGTGRSYDNHLFSRRDMHIDIFNYMIVAK